MSDITESRELLTRLQERFSQVAYRSDGRFEIDKRILLSAIEALALVENKATLEELVMYRNRPSHLMPPHIRRALRRSAPAL